MKEKALRRIVERFNITVPDLTFKAIHQGYINDTYHLYASSSPGYILQRINHFVFKDVEGLQKNICNALDYLSDPDYTSISLIPSAEGKSFVKEESSYWRLMSYVPDSVAHNNAPNKTVAFETGKIIGLFHKLLKDQNIGNYKETLPRFHDLKYRIKQFGAALEHGSATRRSKAVSDIGYAMTLFPFFNEFYRTDLPLRICHNDTKLNNILFNKEGKALCLIDLDTIMPGYFLYDFGDALRTVANPAGEEETDHSKIVFRTDFFKAFVDGLAIHGTFLSGSEKRTLALGAVLMPFIHGLRALTDYLNNDVHYKTAYDDQNLDRCRNLFYFTELARKELPVMQEVIKTVLE